MSSEPGRRDLLIIGGGPGGYVAGIRAGQLGMRAAVIEAERVGGICLNWGCIPTKALLRNAEVLSYVRNASTWGIVLDGFELDFRKVVARSRGVSDRLARGVTALLGKYGCELIPGRARIAGRRGEDLLLEVGEPAGATTELSAGRILVATGGRPRQIPGVPFDGDRIITSREAMVLPEVPERLLVVGAGAIGVEFAFMYNTFGSKVVLVEMLDQVLPVEDTEVAKELERSLRKSGISVHTSTRVDTLERTESGVRAVLHAPSGEVVVDADRALVAIGVQGNTGDLGLEAIGVRVGKSFIQVDRRTYATDAAGVYAVGDVIGPPLLAHVASAEAVAAVEGMAGRERPPLDPDRIPGCTYCHPQVASIGLTERAAAERGLDVRIGRFPFRANGRSLAVGDTAGFVKLLFDAKSGRLLGAHIIGPEATELIAELGLGMTLETTGQHILRTIHAHPTLSEAVMEAAGVAYGEALSF